MKSNDMFSSGSLFSNVITMKRPWSISTSKISSYKHNSFKKVAILSSIFSFVNASIIRTDCTSNRIVGGQSIHENGSPFTANWLVSISMGCGGAWINENTILTAAHCFPNRDLHQGDVWQLYEKNEEGKQQFLGNITGGNIFIHENFSPTSMVNDIALVKFCENSGTHDVIKIAESFIEHESFFVYGWGTMQHGTITVPEILQWVETPYKRVENN